MRLSISILFLFCANLLMAQNLSPDYTAKLGRYGVSNYILESYLSPDGSYAIILKPDKFLIYGADGELLTERKLWPKSAESVENEPKIYTTLQEGSGFMVMPESQAVVLLDWGIGKNKIDVIDLETGNTLWNSENIRFTNSDKEVVEKEVSKRAASFLMDKATKNNNLQKGSAEETIEKRQDAFIASGKKPYISKYIDRLITPISSKNAFLIKIEDGQRYIDLNNADGGWTYKDFPMVVGAYKVLEDAGEIVLVNENVSLTQKNASNNTAVVLSLETGKEQARFDVVDITDSEYITVLNDKIIFDKQNLNVFDVNTGEQLLQTHKRKANNSKVGRFAMNNAQSSANGSQTYDGLNSLINYPYAYTGYIKVIGGNGATTTAFNSLGTKVSIAKYDLQNGEQIWETEGVADAIEKIAFVNDTHLFVLRKSMGKQRIIAMNKETGTVDKEVNIDKGATLWNDKYAILAGKKELEFYDLADVSEPVKSMSYKEMAFGDIENLISTEAGFVAVGESGVAWFNSNGEKQNEILVDDVDEWMLQEHRLILFGKKMINVVDLESQQLTGTIDHSFKDKRDIAVLNARGDQLLIIEDQIRLKAYSF